MRVSGFVMTDESGEVLAVSVGGSADLVKSHAAPESKKDLVAEHERLVDVLRSPDHNDDLAEADKQEAELAEYRGEAAGENLAKSHVKGYTRKDGTFVKEHDDSRQAAMQPVTSDRVNAIHDQHRDLMHRKETEWQHDAKKMPASAVSGLPEFSHKEVYGHNRDVSPVGGDFSPEFAKQGHQGFVLRHKDGKRSFVDTQGSDYARYHAPVEDAPADGGDKVNSDEAFDKISAAGGKNVTTTSGHINYYHHGKRKELAHKDADDGNRYVDSAELEQHLSDLKSAPAKGGDQEKSGAASYDHPNAVGKGDFGSDSPEKAWSMKFAGTEYTHTGKEGHSMHDQTPVREFESEDGHRVWADGAGRVHADSTSEVADLRQKYEASVKPAGKKPAESGGSDGDAPKDGDVGFHEHSTYGVYHKPGSTVKDNSGKTHKVLEHRGAQVLMEDGTWFHPTKVQKQGDKPMAKALLFVQAGGSDELLEMSKAVSIGAGSGD